MKINKKLITVLSLGFLALSGCNSFDKPNKPNPTPTVRDYFDIEDFDAPVDMHTAEQKAFVDYKERGNYEDLTKEHQFYLCQYFVKKEQAHDCPNQNQNYRQCPQ